MIEKRARKQGGIKSIAKAARVLNMLADAGGPLSLAQMAAAMTISKSTLHGIISTLVDVKFVTQEQHSMRYRLGTRLFEIGCAISSQWNVRKIAYAYIQQIVAEVGETVHMAVLDDYEVLYINKQESTNSIRIVTDIGVKLPAHCTGLGKALLSGKSKLELQYMVKKKGLSKHTEFTITDFESLLKELELIRSRGYSIDEQEFVEGLRCVAVPIFDHAGEITAALSVSGPVSRMHDKKFEHCRESLTRAASEISLGMGYEKKSNR